MEKKICHAIEQADESFITHYINRLCIHCKVMTEFSHLNLFISERRIRANSCLKHCVSGEEWKLLKG